jgi:hypothetical protein
VCVVLAVLGWVTVAALWPSEAELLLCEVVLCELLEDPLEVPVVDWVPAPDDVDFA